MAFVYVACELYGIRVMFFDRKLSFLNNKHRDPLFMGLLCVWTTLSLPRHQGANSNMGMARKEHGLP